jgi:hypothetical protein
LKGLRGSEDRERGKEENMRGQRDNIFSKQLEHIQTKHEQEDNKKRRKDRYNIYKV